MVIMEKFAIHIGLTGSTFVKGYDFFVSQGGLTEKWGKYWEIVEAESLQAARLIAINRPGARAGLYCKDCGGVNGSCDCFHDNNRDTLS